jgi:transitional endoplasmic reticulum ATPase
LQELSEQTEGFTGADLENLCQEAALMALREGMEAASLVEARHFSSARAAATPSLLPDVPGHRGHAGRKS